MKFLLVILVIQYTLKFIVGLKLIKLNTFVDEEVKNGETNEVIILRYQKFTILGMLLGIIMNLLELIFIPGIVGYNIYNL